MLTNADCTVYETNGSKSNLTVLGKHFIPGVYWNDSRGAVTTKNGVQISDSVTVYIYSDDYLPKAGDIIVKGNADFEFDSSSQRSMSESKNKFSELFPDSATVRSVNDCRYGGLPHIEVIAR